MINALPEHTQTRRRISGIPEQYDGWSNTDLVIGRLYDLIAVAHWQWLRTLDVKDVPDDPPESILPSAPDDTRQASESTKTVSLSDAAALMTASAETFTERMTN